MDIISFILGIMYCYTFLYYEKRITIFVNILSNVDVLFIHELSDYVTNVTLC